MSTSAADGGAAVPARRCVVLAGDPAQTAVAARRWLASGVAHPAAAVLWVGGAAEAPSGAVVAEAHRVRALLGRAFDAVVVDLHGGPGSAGFDADVLGQCHGLVWGGGALILRVPPAPPPAPALAVWPYSAADVTHRLWERLAPLLRAADDGGAPGPAWRAHGGSSDQAAAVSRIARHLQDGRRTPVVVLARRGRGKSSALGLALRAAGLGDVAVATADRAESTAELVRFAGAPAVRYAPPIEVAAGLPGARVIAVDEAAQLPVPLLRRMVAANPGAALLFATTVDGYEGTGRGFVLRFLAWLRGLGPVDEVHLRAPIRWAEHDALERAVRDGLLLDAEPAALDLRDGCAEVHAQPMVLDRDALVADPRRLAEVFGLLVHAHYRTTPGDLHRLLDAPNLALHGLASDAGRVVAVAVVAREGGLTPELCAALAGGGERIRGHALPDTLICHCGALAAGELAMIRSVRIAVHPAVRRQGLARRLIDHVHQSYAVDLFGTMFGAIPEVVRLRRSMGYALVRVGLSPGARTGEPAAVMLRPLSARARALTEGLAGALARDLDGVVARLRADGHSADDALIDELRAAAGPPAEPPGPDAVWDAVRQYATGPRPFDAVAAEVARWVAADPDAVAKLPAQARAVVVGRAVDGRGWVELARASGYDSVPAAMRAARRAIAEAVSGRPGG